MAEYIEREALIKDFNLNFGGVSHAVIAAGIINNAPAADVVEVVRCKDCRKLRGNGTCNITEMICGQNDFCSYGERKDND